MFFTKKENGASLEIAVKDRLDIITVPQLEAELSRSLPGVSDVTFDFQELKYISSAGLWLLLTIYKSLIGKGAMRVINASPAVREVFESTGFSYMLGD